MSTPNYAAGLSLNIFIYVFPPIFYDYFGACISHHHTPSRLSCLLFVSFVLPEESTRTKLVALYTVHIRQLSETQSVLQVPIAPLLPLLS